jgi:peptidoglycan/xylan/chitin deacetylase (PgdA/CDA1 family)
MYGETHAICLAVLLMTVAASCHGEQPGEFKWPNGTRAAVSLAYDDALDSHLDNAIPALNRHGFRGSFYLTLSSKTVSRRLADWRAAASQGHELGNHSLFHQCSAAGPGREWVQPWHDLDSIKARDMQEQVILANSMLHAIDGRTERTFTVPCGDVMAAGEDYLGPLRGEFVAIKMRVGDVAQDIGRLDPYAVEVFAPADVSGEELIGMAREAAERGTMANFTFHGIGGDYLSVSTEAHERLLQYLSENRDVYWVDTFLNVMKYVKKYR